jgi:hypothetical protein
MSSGRNFNKINRQDQLTFKRCRPQNVKLSFKKPLTFLKKKNWLKYWRMALGPKKDIEYSLLKLSLINKCEEKKGKG